MSLMGTLAKIAIGYASARGIDKLTSGQGMGGGAQVKSTETGGLGDMMSQMTGGTEGQTNPLQGLMEQMQKGGLDLSALMGGGQSGESGDKGGLLSSAPGGDPGLAGMLAGVGAMAQAQGKGLGGLIDQFNTAETAPDAEAAAALMLRAMIQAAKADGGIDDAEKAKILETVGDDADAEDMAFIKDQLAAEVDIKGLAADTPAAQKMQVYSASLTTIRVDTQAEAQYLHQLAQALGIPEAGVNAMHVQLGLRPLYA
ncbi:tellurite resistance TerB family protein [Primorskyibacter marinus]|uniref:tellurite resistance TerB family protein n=1 Tax=Primorskyibacter marinus TaxID=1977320 RepID=UPI000E30253E|nr:tellurite resistance TerB family protein [Primorskyibacter marinus]